MVEQVSPLEAAFDVPEEKPVLFQEEETLTDDTIGLLQLGYLSDTVQIGTHEIRIRTLKIGEELNAALIANKYKDTVEEARALATALVAASIVSVDNGPLLDKPIGPRDSALEAKFDYVVTNWYWTTISLVWEKYNELLKRVEKSVDEIKKG